MNRIIFRHINKIFWILSPINRNNINVLKILKCCPQRHAANTAKSINAYFNCHDYYLRFTNKKGAKKIGSLRLAYVNNYRTDLTVFTTFSTVKPKCLSNTPPGADSPNVSIPTTAPSKPTYLRQKSG